MIHNRVIDFHVHVGCFHRLRADIQHLLDQAKSEKDFDLENLFSSPRDLARYLRREGIWKAIILAEEGPGTNFHITTDFVCDFRDDASKCISDLFLAFGNLNPHRTQDLMSKYNADSQRGIRGYKLYPADHDYHPVTNELMQFYKRLEADGLVLMFHTGFTSQVDGNNEYGDPFLFRPILEECPTLPVIFAHAGKPDFCKEAAFCAKHYPNCYLDTAFILPKKLLRLLPDLEEFSEKVVFGSDWPAGVHSLSGHIEEFFHSGLSDEAIERILFLNAATILKIDPDTDREGS